MFLRELRFPVTRIRGVGPAMASAFARLGITTVSDLLMAAPRDYQDRSLPLRFEDAARVLLGASTEPGAAAARVNTVVTVVRQLYIGRGRKRILKVIVEEDPRSEDADGASVARDAAAEPPESGEREAAGERPRRGASDAALRRPASPDRGAGRFGEPLLPLEPNGALRASLVCFNRTFLSRVLLPGKRFYLFGNVSFRYGELQCTTFEIDPCDDNYTRSVKIVPVYALTEGLSQTNVRKAVGAALAEYGDRLEDELPPSIAERRAIGPKARSLRAVHLPQSLEEAAAARAALAFEELFYLQLSVARRALRRRTEHRSIPPYSVRLQEAALARLPFTLTPDQQTVLVEINRDLQSPRPMARLLQGEVGSGKTLVAFLAALGVIAGGRQVALMAPTELLARQHAENAVRLLAPLGVRLAFLSGNVDAAGRTELLSALASGEIDLVIGTHALFSRGVAFRSLGLGIVDEQHRFGVAQRLALLSKGDSADLLLMTATPIPRTLALTLFGDLDVSTIRTMPAGRKPIATHLAREGNEKKVYDWVRAEIEKGRQAYFVYPLIQQSEKLEVKDAESMAEHLARFVFPTARVGLIHSRLPEEQKGETMERFVRHEIDILVATSVVEVGVDVSNASVMVVEHAERFGLAALHQLRGRVGRGSEQSYCFLVYAEELTDEGKERLRVLKETNDGFRIAEEDLRLRGPGEITGLRQAGYFRLAFADLARDVELLAWAREDAFALVERDPGLIEAENRALREAIERAAPFDEQMLGGG